MQPFEPRLHADPLRDDLCRYLGADLHRGGPDQERLPASSGRPGDPDRRHVCAVQEIGERECMTDFSLKAFFQQTIKEAGNHLISRLFYAVQQYKKGIYLRLRLWAFANHKNRYKSG